MANRKTEITQKQYDALVSIINDDQKLWDVLIAINAVVTPKKVNKPFIYHLFFDLVNDAQNNSTAEIVLELADIFKFEYRDAWEMSQIYNFRDPKPFYSTMNLKEARKIVDRMRKVGSPVSFYQTTE